MHSLKLNLPSSATFQDNKKPPKLEFYQAFNKDTRLCLGWFMWMELWGVNPGPKSLYPEKVLSSCYCYSLFFLGFTILHRSKSHVYATLQNLTKII